MTKPVMPIPVWHEAPFWIEHGASYPIHDVRQSADDPALVAYFPNEDKRGRDLRTKVKPGRYLTQFFSNVLSEKQIKYYATWQATQTRPDESAAPTILDELFFATTPDDIEEVYINGPHSCMSEPARHYRDEHPVRVYGAGDLAIAYIKDEAGEKPIGRALVWPERKVYGRVYPTPCGSWSRDGYPSEEASAEVQARTEMALRKAGYLSLCESDKGFDGAKLLRIEIDDSTLVMPYLDGGYMFDDCGEFLRLAIRGEFSADNTDGTARLAPEYYCTCERCGDGINNEEDAYSVATSARHGGSCYGSWCYSCYEDSTFHCTGYNETFSDSVDSAKMEGDTYSVHWLEGTATFSSYSGEWFSGNPVEMDNGDVWSEDEFDENGFTCDISERNYPNEERHPDYPAIHRDTAPDDIAEWLGENAPAQAAHAVQGVIEDERQLALETV